MNDESFKNFVVDQLRQIPNLQCRRMFGGYGLYADAGFFGIIYHGKLYFKTDNDTVKDYQDEGMKPFRPSKQQTLKQYYEVPALRLEDPKALTDWATKALNVKLK